MIRITQKILRGSATEHGLQLAIESAQETANRPMRPEHTLDGRVIGVIESRRRVKRGADAWILEPTFQLISRATHRRSHDLDPKTHVLAAIIYPAATSRTRRKAIRTQRARRKRTRGW